VAMLRRQVKRQSFDPADRAFSPCSAGCFPGLAGLPPA
jgi:hypothetical protein